MVNINRLKGEVKANDMTTAMIAHKMGISENTLNNLYNGRTTFKVSHVEELCKILNLTAEQRDAIFFAD